jgi:hypothetical protein
MVLMTSSLNNLIKSFKGEQNGSWRVAHIIEEEQSGKKYSLSIPNKKEKVGGLNHSGWEWVGLERNNK